MTDRSHVEIRDAIREGDTEKVRELIAAGADVHYQHDGGYDALMDAVFSKALE